MTNTNVAAETISNTIYETKPYGTPEEFNLQAISEKIIDVEYTEVDDNLERKSANDNGINNNPTPPVTTNALIPVGNSCLSVALPVAPANLISCIGINQSIAEATMKMVKKYGFTKSDMEQLYQKAWKHAAIVFEAQSRLGKFFKNIGTAQGSRTDLLKTIANKQLPGKSEKKLMEREIAKGSCPLKLDHIEFGNYSYQEITSKEKLLEVLSYLLRIGDFKQYAGKTILNNVYMDLRGKKPVFKRTKTAVERNNIFATIRRYAKKLKPQYNGDVYLETVRCYFDISQENLEKCRYTYQGNETYAFLMSDKYIMALYTHCLVARKEAAVQDLRVEGFTEKEYEMVRLENVGDVLFQALMLDDVKIKDGMMYADFLSVILDNIVDNY